MTCRVFSDGNDQDQQQLAVLSQDVPGCLDHPVLTRMPGFLIEAAAVAQQLTTGHGISEERLMPPGVGPLAPASNATEAGRALKRRVELVQ